MATPGLENAKLSERAAAELSIGDVLRIFRQRYLTLLIAAILCLLLAVAYLLTATRKYTATATIEINKDNTMSLGMDDLSGIGSKLGTGADLLTDMMTHQADLENQSTALDVITRMNLLASPPFATEPGKVPALDAERGLPLDKAPVTRERAIRLFLGHLKVKLVKNTRLIDVSYTDTDPTRAASIANTTVDVYLGNHTEARYAASLKTSRWLTAQLAELKDKVAESERRVSQFQQQEGLVGVYVSPDDKGAGAAGLPKVSSVEDERLVALNSSLTRAEIDRIGKEALYHLAETGDPDVIARLGTGSLSGAGAAEAEAPGSPGEAASTLLSDVTTLNALRQQETALKLQNASAITRYGPRNPELAEVNNQLAVIATQIQAELARIVGHARSDFELARIAEQNIRAKVAEQQKLVGKLDQSVAGLLVLEQESASNRLLYQDMYTRLEEANLTAGLGTGVITIADPARASAHPSSPVAVKVLGASLAMGLLLGSVGALVLDQTQNILYTTEEFSHILPFAELGLIPDFGARRKRGYGVSVRPEALFQ